MEDCLIPNEDFTPRYVSHYKSSEVDGTNSLREQEDDWLPSSENDLKNIHYTRNCCNLKPRMVVTQDDRGRSKPSRCLYGPDLRCDHVLHLVVVQGLGSNYKSSGLEFYSTMIIVLHLESNGLYGLFFGQRMTWDPEIRVIKILKQHLEDKVKDPMLEHDKVEDTKTISDSGILKLLNDTKKWTMKKNIYSCLGILYKFNYATTQEKCLMLSSMVSCLSIQGQSTRCSLPESRFGEVLVITAGYKFELVNEIKPEVLSPDTTYESYFVYKLPSDQSKLEFPLK
nr:protein kinase-like domain, phloem protein 2-like protein [Tanacetum cinerariifolium]